MIELKEYIKESLLDDEDVLMDDRIKDDLIKEEIKKFLKDNYGISSRYKIGDNPVDGKYVVDYDGRLRVENNDITSLTNEYFVFGFVRGDFDCMGCDYLTSLEGAPRKVGGDFNCSYCKQQFTINDVEKESKIKGRILCDTSAK